MPTTSRKALNAGGMRITNQLEQKGESALGMTEKLQEKHKILITGLLLAIMCFLTYYFLVVWAADIPFGHAYYLPIIFASLWWKRKGLAVAIFLVLLFLAGHWFAGLPSLTIANFTQAEAFVLVAYVIAMVSERQAGVEKKLYQSHDTLEIRVAERTAAQEEAGEALRVEITERKRMEREIEERQEYLASVLRHAPDAIVAVDVSNSIVEWNPGAQRLFGYSHDEAWGKNLDDLIGRPDIEEQFRFVTAQLLSGKEIPSTEVACYRKNGTRLNVILAGSPIIIGGRVKGFVATYHDITERKWMEREIEERQEYLASVLRHAPDAIVTVDAFNRIVEWNPGAKRLLGYSHDEVQGENLDGLIGRPDIEEQFRFVTAQLLSGKEIPSTEVACYRKDGTRLNVILAGSPIRIGGQMEGFVVTCHDITKRKRMEKDLKAKEMQLIHAGRLSSLGEMATGVAHEINQPLAIISMVAEGRLRDIERGRFDVSILPQELEDILKNVRRIDRIITHMRTFARREEEWESVEPEAVLDNVFILFGEQFRVHQISISREIEAGLPAIKVDANQLEQVFVNILTNARQILDEKAEEAEMEGKVFEKRLVCEISRVEEEAGEYVVFEFADNAYGVPDELKTRVFDPFLTTKEAGKGTGLGLSIAYGIVTQSLGGRIWVEDNEMGGASFKVALPVGEEPGASTS